MGALACSLATASSALTLCGGLVGGLVVFNGVYVGLEGYIGGLVV